MSFGSKLNSPDISNRHSLYKELLDSLPAAIYLCDVDGYVTTYNEAAVKLWGRRPEVGKDLWCGSWKIFNPDGTPLSPDACPMALTLKSGEPVTGNEIIIEQPNGSRFNILPHPHPLFDKDGILVGAVNMLVDVTHESRYKILEQKTAELEKRAEALKRIQQFNEDLKAKNELLRLSEERYHRMVSEVEDYVIILLDAGGYIQNWNKGVQKIKGYSAEEIIGKHFSIFYSEEDKAKGIPEKLLAEALKRGKALHEGRRLRKDGSTFWGSVVMTALYNGDGTVLGFTKVTRDLTDKRMAEEQLKATSLTLQQKNKELERTNEELSSFAYISSHDLQEPLRKIQTFSDRIMEMEYENLSENGKDYFRRMQAGASRMQKLIQDILAYSRTTTSEKKLEVTNLNDLLNQAKVELEVMIHEKKAVIESDQLPSIKVIPFQVQQLFNNLLHNALKFSKADVPPHIVIRSELVDGRGFEEPYPPLSKEYWHISFTDNGIGFEPEYNRKIFEVFQRLHGRNEYGGTGIGLAICKKIVENHNGHLTAESRPGHGATFHIYLPLVA